jgi:hypothetical protein
LAFTIASKSTGDTSSAGAGREKPTLLTRIFRGPSRSLGLGHGAVDLGEVGDVHLEGQRRAAFGRDPFHHRPAAGGIAQAERHAGAAGRELARDGGADAAAGAGDERRLAVELPAHGADRRVAKRDSRGDRAGCGHGFGLRGRGEAHLLLEPAAFDHVEEVLAALGQVEVEAEEGLGPGVGGEARAEAAGGGEAGYLGGRQREERDRPGLVGADQVPHGGRLGRAIEGHGKGVGVGGDGAQVGGLEVGHEGDGARVVARQEQLVLPVEAVLPEGEVEEAVGVAVLDPLLAHRAGGGAEAVEVLGRDPQDLLGEGLGHQGVEARIDRISARKATISADRTWPT